MRFGAYAIIYLAASVNSLIVAGWIYIRHKKLDTFEDEVFGSAVLVSGGVWMLCHVMERVSQGTAAKLMWDKLEYVGIALICTTWIVYACQYTGYVGKTARRLWISGTVISLIALSFVMTNDMHNFIWKDTVVFYGSGEVLKTYAPGFYIVISYFMGTCAALAIFMIRNAGKVSKFYKAQAKLIPTLALFPIVLVVMEQVFLFKPFQPYQLTPLAFSVSTWIITFTLPVMRKSDLLNSSMEVVMEKMDDAVLVLDEKGNIVDLNAAALFALKMKYRQEAIGQSANEIFETFDKDSICIGDRCYEPVFSEVHDAGENIVSRIAVLRDITERLSNEQAMLEFAGELKTRNEELHQFTFAASHDLQEPLRMVSNYLGLLKRRYNAELDRNATEYIEFAAEGAKRMEALLDALLDYSRVGSRELGIEEVALDGVIDEVKQNLKLAIEETAAYLTFDRLPKTVGDRLQLVQLFQNLISNAIKFRSESRKLEIKITGKKQGTEIILAVSDNGIGIEADQHDRIFQIFQRLHTREEYEGSGIGLAICKRIVERHGGRIWLESEPELGSAFYFTLPQKTPPNTIV